MFNCNHHGWTSFERSCPECFPDTYTATDLTKEDQKDGLYGQPEVLYRWVKASERLPGINRKVILRFPWHDNTIVLDYGQIKVREREDNQQWFATDNYGSIPERELELEWLEPIPSNLINP